MRVARGVDIAFGTVEPRGIAVISPNAAEQDFIHTKYMDELVNARFLDSETRCWQSPNACSTTPTSKA